MQQFERNIMVSSRAKDGQKEVLDFMSDLWILYSFID
jgi:hypothetical protein